MAKTTDCCFCVDKDWFRYRVGAIIISEGHALFSYGEDAKHFYSVGGGVHVGEHSEEAILREVFEETGEHFEIERPLCLVENFFYGNATLESLNCHTIEYYYLMKPKEKKAYDVHSVTTAGENEKMCWLPIDKLDEYDIRPILLKELAKNPPEHFTAFVNDQRV